MMFVNAGSVKAQQLEPRAYQPAPVGMNILGFTYQYSHGEVLLDPSVPIENVDARAQIAAPFYGRIFDFFGRQASVTIATPFAQLDATGDVLGEERSANRSGLGDPSLRLAVNLIGLPALNLKEFTSREPETILGASLTVTAPLGQYDSSKLVNLGTNRWAFKPELGLSYPLGHWNFEVYLGVWLFTDNDNFFGGQVRRQEPLVSTQGHVVYTFLPNFWASLDYTYYSGGQTTVNGQQKYDRQDNSRGGITLAVPVFLGQSIKVAWSKGVSTRVGSAFETFGASWQFVWF
jgi:hypothetical protein